MVRKIAVITNGAFPVPAVRGGAMETLVEELAQQNERFAEAEFTIISVYDEQALQASRSYQRTRFVFLKPDPFLAGMDHVIHFMADNVLHRKDHLAFKTALQRSGYVRAVARHLAASDYDAVVFENQMAQLWSLKYRDNEKRYAGRCYFHIHNHPARYAHAEKLAAEMNKIICVSSFIGRTFAEKTGIPYTDAHFAVLPNGVDTAVFSRASLEESEVIELRRRFARDDQKLIIFTGRMMPGKGIMELLHAFSRMQYQDAVLVVVGSFNFNDQSANPFQKEIQEAAGQCAKKIVFTGYIPHDQLPAYYAMADFAVLPSTIEEAAGLTIMEAIIMRLPVITTTMGGISEYADDTCAVLLENDSRLTDHLAEQMDRFCRDDALRQQLSKGAEMRSKGWDLATFYHSFLKIVG